MPDLTPVTIPITVPTATVPITTPPARVVLTGIPETPGVPYVLPFQLGT